MAEELGERTEDPTGRRLGEARSKGQVAKSPDLGSAIGLIGGLILMLVFGSSLFRAMGVILRAALEGDPTDLIDSSAVAPALLRALGQGALAAAPIFALVVVIAAFSQYVQVGWLITLEPIKPKLNALNPMSGIKRLIGTRGLVKSLSGIMKMSLVGLVAWMVIARQLRRLAALPSMEAVAALQTILMLAVELATWLLAILLIIALADWVYHKWQHKKDLKMTKQEVKDERRMMDGSPEVKKRRMRMAMDIAMHRVQQAVPKADVVVTNPTHFAVALKYDPKTMRAPRVLAKGVDFMAMRIRHVAMSTHVQIVERPPLARALYWGTEVGQEVSPEHYEAVAEVLAFVYRLKEKKVA